MTLTKKTLYSTLTIIFLVLTIFSFSVNKNISYANDDIPNILSKNSFIYSYDENKSKITFLSNFWEIKEEIADIYIIFSKNIDRHNAKYLKMNLTKDKVFNLTLPIEFIKTYDNYYFEVNLKNGFKYYFTIQDPKDNIDKIIERKESRLDSTLKIENIENIFPKKSEINNNLEKNKFGWYSLSNDWFYKKPDGNKAISEWLYDENYSSWYHLNQNGKMAKSEWIKHSDNNWYYLKQNGKMAESEWIKHSDNNWYYLKQNGKMAESEWIKHSDNNWYYLKQNGKMAESEWIKHSDNNWYYLKQNGKMAESEWIKHSDNNWYYLKQNGKMAKSEYIGKWYVNNNGKYIK
ncbi:N-acetylmuramoyl-L-alanine amidase family protein [Helcococcus ovis]|uniref:N-acetylmuramoyl-L-alanine amidase family protein n=1 Tax=Helcococcus ovis TaxID=72026 RepID=A0A4R9C4A4_9FIRM|nr:N-acetylmuramoyl-L-alanine amidase family protein [Helcococcus ovis]TFF67460.1 N-acetylmuramoyl-L-alanine amidase family protein [Helcococcus ovis]